MLSNPLSVKIFPRIEISLHAENYPHGNQPQLQYPPFPKNICILPSKKYYT